MFRLKISKLALAVALGLTLGVSSASADMITLTLNTPNAGGAPYAGPYGTVTVNLTDSTHATFTYTSNTTGVDNGGNNTAYLFSDGSSAAANINASSFTVGTISSTQTGANFNAASLSLTNPPGTGQVDGFGKFNLTIDNSSGFDVSVNSITFTVTNTSSTWATASDVLTPVGGAGGAEVASHIYATLIPIDKNNGALGFGGQSGTFYARDGDSPVVPVPPSVFLMGLGGLCFLGFLRLNRRGQPITV